MKYTEIETERLRLRRYTLDDLDALNQIFSDEKVMRYLENGSVCDKKETQRHLLNYVYLYWEDYGFGRWALTDKKSGKLIGHCGFRAFNYMPELVYLLTSDYWGKGIITEASKACLRYAFEEMQYEQIVAVVKVANTASRRVLEKLGMQCEKEAKLYGYDCVFYTIAQQDYQPDNSLYGLYFKDAKQRNLSFRQFVSHKFRTFQSEFLRQFRVDNI